MAFSISPFALPNTSDPEYRFEEPRDIRRVVVMFKNSPGEVSLAYLRNTWPQHRVENTSPMEDPFSFGWFPIDDHYNASWQKASVKVEYTGGETVEITFIPLTKEFPDCGDYDVRFRRTMGIRIEGGEVEKAEIFTESPEVESTIRVRLDAGKSTSGKRIGFSTYNSQILEVIPVSGVHTEGPGVSLGSGERVFLLRLSHMRPGKPYSGDDGLVTFHLDDDACTISLTSLEQQGPIWLEDRGFYITSADDETSFDEYLSRTRDVKSISRRVLEQPEQSFANAFHGQPRPHPVACSIGCKHARQRFWIEPNGDVVLTKSNVTWVAGKDTARFRNAADARFFFGLGGWPSVGRFADPSPIIGCNIHLRHGDIKLEQKSFAVPLKKSILGGELAGDDAIIAMVRFRFRNQGDKAAVAELPIYYSSNSRRSYNRPGTRRFPPGSQDDNLVPLSEKERLRINGTRLTSVYEGQETLRCILDSAMETSKSGDGVLLRRELQPGESCEALLKIPFIALDSADEINALSGLDFDRLYPEVSQFWRQEGQEGAAIVTPVSYLNDLYAAHLSHVQITDFCMPNDPSLINTSVGTSTYGNFSNESCMIIQELDQRGLHDEARRRLEVWLKYQGTAELQGNFTDYDGVFYGAGGFESGHTYNQHHGWILWCLAEHYFATRDDTWLSRIAGKLILGADWVFRQRKNTMTDSPFSRGWEYGFLPAGSLEDVADYHHWLSTNAVTWRGLDRVAHALEAIAHPEAERIRSEADAYRLDLINGFENMRRHSPLVRLRDGRWIPCYPSRLYRRGRDIGWIREVLEGSVYLLISGLYDPDSREAQWILEDFQDNRYMSPPYGYHVPNLERNWFDYGGFSCQPNLLAGLMPYLDRDEPELYIWMFFNAWAACYREEIGAMVEHPQPVLGHSNSAHFKTSDQANAVMWLRYMFVYAPDDGLYLGRAIPRKWLADGESVSAEGVNTRYGDVIARWESHASTGRISIQTILDLHSEPERIIARIRHPENLPIKSVRVNGQAHGAFDRVKGDIDLTGLKGELLVEAAY